MAGEWLNHHNSHNRRFDKSHALEIEKDMLNGRFRYDGSPIRFDANGNILDGQHRLWAIWHSGLAQKINIVYNLPKETLETIDTGMKIRSMGDVLLLNENIKNSVVVASGVNNYLSLKLKNVLANNDGKGVNLKRKYSKSEKLSVYRANKEVWDKAGSYCSHNKRTQYFAASRMCGYIGYLQIDKKHSESDVYAMFDKLTGNDMSNTTLNTLRSYLIQAKDKSKHITGAEMTAKINQAINSYFEGKQLTRLVYKGQYVDLI